VDAPEAILIIDPDKRRRAFARDVLDRAGYDVRTAADEDAAAALLGEWSPVAVVAATPPRRRELAARPVIAIGTPAASVPEHARLVMAAPFDRADLLAAVWVATNP